MADSIVVRLRPGVSRSEAINSGTICFELTRASRESFRDVFIENYESIRSSREALTTPGITVAVVGPHGFEGAAAVPARPDHINTLSIGRHGCAQLHLPGNPLMSLRQGLLIVYPRRTGEGLRFRALDLRALAPFENERGQPFAALEADGAVFLNADTSFFFIFPSSPDERPWTGTPEEVWDRLPERVYLEELEIGQARAHSDRRPERLPATAGTLALSLPGILFAEGDRLLHEGEPPHARLVVRSATEELVLQLGESAITRGVLLGRYDRCDGSRFALLSDPSISRVHALVIRIAGKIYAVDAGSTNGLWLGETRVLAAELGLGRPVMLAEHATVECSFLH